MDVMVAGNPYQSISRRIRFFLARATVLLALACGFALVGAVAAEAVAPTSAYAMQIFVEPPDGNRVSFEAENADTIESVKQKVEDIEGTPIDLQVLYFNGVQLDDERTLQDYNIQKEAVLQLRILERFAVAGGIKGVDYRYENNTLTVMSETTLTVSRSSSTDCIVVGEGVAASLVLDGVQANLSSQSKAALRVMAGGSLHLSLSHSNSLVSGDGHAGLELADASSSLVIDGTGSLRVEGGNAGAGIGGGSAGKAGDITIAAGAIEAVGGPSAAGIGSGARGDCASITIAGGAIRVTEGVGGEAIGAGANGQVGSIQISGGVFADTTPSAIADNVVFGVAPLDGFGVEGNQDAATKQAYPVGVYPFGATTLALNPAKNLVYNGKPISLADLGLTACYGEEPASDRCAITFSRKGASESVFPAKAGTYLVSAHLPKAKIGETFYPEREASVEFTIAKALLIFRAADASMIAGRELPSFTYVMEGLVQGDELLVAPAIEAQTDGAAAGLFPIAIASARVSNADCYDVVYRSGTLAVKAAPSIIGEDQPGSSPGAYLASTGDSLGIAPMTIFSFAALCGLAILCRMGFCLRRRLSPSCRRFR